MNTNKKVSTSRTTIKMRDDLLLRLKMYMKANNVTMSEIIEKGVQNVLDKSEEKNAERVASGLLKLAGFAKSNETNVSENIDEILYGENGAWRGSEREK